MHGKWKGILFCALDEQLDEPMLSFFHSQSLLAQNRRCNVAILHLVGDIYLLQNDITGFVICMPRIAVQNPAYIVPCYIVTHMAYIIIVTAPYRAIQYCMIKR